MDESLRQILKPHLVEHAPPGGEAVFSVTWTGVEELARQLGLGLCQAMIACLHEGVWPERLRPNRGSLDAAEQARLLSSKVAVIGCGGLGGAVVLELTRLGVGGLVLCDSDHFEESNLNRQLLCTPANLGRPKAMVAAETARQLNPGITAAVHPVAAMPANLPEILAGADVAVDCLDNMASRYHLQDAAAEAGIPMVHGALAGMEGMVMTIRPGDPGLKGMHGPRPTPKREGAETMLGTPTPTPAFIATLQVAEVMKIVLQRPCLDQGRLAHVDLGAPSIEILTLA